MPSESYAKNKQYALTYNSKNKEKIREINRLNKRKYDAFWREFRRLSNMLLVDM